MKYNTTRFIKIMNYDKMTFEAQEVKASEVVIYTASYGYEITPHLFIHKYENIYRLSEGFTGLLVYQSNRLKDVENYLNNSENIKAIVCRLNDPKIKNTIKDFEQMKYENILNGLNVA